MLHDYLHCLVFKEQSCLALLAKCPSLQATHLSYHQQFSLSRTFSNSFLKLFGTFQCLASQGFATLFCVRVCQRLVLYYTSRKDMSTPFLQKHTKSYLVLQTGTCFVDFAECLAGSESTSLLHAPVTTAHWHRYVLLMHLASQPAAVATFHKTRPRLQAAPLY